MWVFFLLGKLNLLHEVDQLLSDTITAKSPITLKLFSAYIALFKLIAIDNAVESGKNKTTTKTAATDSGLEKDVPPFSTEVVLDSTTRRRHGSLMLRLLNFVVSQNKGKVVGDQWLSTEAVAEELCDVKDVKEDLLCEDVDIQALWTNILR